MPIPLAESGPERSLLRDDVFERLLEAIVDGVLAPGEQVRDGELADRLGVSRTPVREALLRLAEVGLVVTRPGRSTVVTALDLTAVHEAREVVAAMHAVAVRSAVGRLAPADVDEMRAANERFARAVRAGDLDEAQRADEALHAVPVRVAGNRAVMGVLEQFTPVLRRAEKLRYATAVGQWSIDVHAALVEACAAGDAARAATVTYETWELLVDEPGDGPGSGGEGIEARPSGTGGS